MGRDAARRRTGARPARARLLQTVVMRPSSHGVRAAPRPHPHLPEKPPHRRVGTHNHAARPERRKGLTVPNLTARAADAGYSVVLRHVGWPVVILAPEAWRPERWAPIVKQQTPVAAVHFSLLLLVWPHNELDLSRGRPLDRHANTILPSRPRRR
jgi:hypothetical protein